MMTPRSENSVTAHAAGPPRRRWLQFSLRTMLLLMVPVACVAAWMGAEYRKGLRQKEAIAWVEKMRGQIEYDDEATQNDWRRQWFGEWFPESVKVIDFYYSESRDEITDIAPLAELKNLERLGIVYTHVSDLSPLTKLENLRQLLLYYIQVSLEQAQALRQALPNCRIYGP